MEERIHFLTYGNERFKKSLVRIEREATQFQLFHTIQCFREQDLKDDPTFWPRHGEFLMKHSRGNGYWLWKPYLILKTLLQCKEGDLVIYADAGCTLNVRGKATLLTWLQELRKTPKGILLFEMVHPEHVWTKKDVFVDLKAEHLRGTRQRLGGIQFLRVCPESIAFCKEVYEFMSLYSHIDDSPSKAPNFPGFKEHRHDQSCLSLLSKLHGIPLLPKRYHQHPENPIWDTRIRC